MLRFPLKIAAPAVAIRNLKDCEEPLGEKWWCVVNEDGQLLPDNDNSCRVRVMACRVSWCCSQMKTRIVVRNLADLDALVYSAGYWSGIAENAQDTEFPPRQAYRGLLKIYNEVKALRRRLVVGQG